MFFRGQFILDLHIFVANSALLQFCTFWGTFGPHFVGGGTFGQHFVGGGTTYFDGLMAPLKEPRNVKEGL